MYQCTTPYGVLLYSYFHKTIESVRHQAAEDFRDSIAKEYDEYLDREYIVYIENVDLQPCRVLKTDQGAYISGLHRYMDKVANDFVIVDLTFSDDNTLM